MPAAFPYSVTFPAPQGAIYTDTELQPGVSTAIPAGYPSQWGMTVPYSLEAQRFSDLQNRQNLLKPRNIQVQTKNFRTDQDNGAANFLDSYTTVSEAQL